MHEHTHSHYPSVTSCTQGLKAVVWPSSLSSWGGVILISVVSLADLSYVWRCAFPWHFMRSVRFVSHLAAISDKHGPGKVTPVWIYPSQMFLSFSTVILFGIWLYWIHKYQVVLTLQKFIILANLPKHLFVKCQKKKKRSITSCLNDKLFCLING